MLYFAIMISLYDILEASKGQLFGEPAAQLFTSFCLDSRLAQPSQLYVSLKTDRGDTHQYIEEAIRNGAAGVLCNRPPDCDTTGVSVVLTRDVNGALMTWSHYVLGKLGVHVIAVTGTSGKAVAVEAITKVLSTQYTVLQGESDVDGPLSVPLSLAKLTPEHNLIVMRAATRQPGDMAEMVQAIEPDVAVVTHIGHAYMDHFESVDQIMQEKNILTNYLSPSGLAVLNYDDDLVRKLSTRASVMTVSVENFGADLIAYGIVEGPNGTGFDLRFGSERYAGRWIPLLGRHQLYGVLTALVIGQHYGVTLEDALKVLNTIKPLPGRMNLLTGANGALLVDDTYDANPESTLAALDWLKAVKHEPHRAIFVMGDMDNMGSYSQIGHRQIGQHAAAIADFIVTEGADAAVVGRAALDQGVDETKVRITYSTQDAAAAVIEDFPLTENDIVLVKGGASARMDLVVRALLKNPEDSERLARQDSALPGGLWQPPRPSWLEIDTNALASNVLAIKELIGRSVGLMAVVKANGYGHGAVTAGRTALLNGAEYLAVASMSEALELRDAGISAPILVLSYTPAYAVRQALRQHITLTLYDLEVARAYDRAARDLGGKLNVHVKVDTGMGRLGVTPDEVVGLFRHLSMMHNLHVEGIYTHFSSADEDTEYTNAQLDKFKALLRPLRASGFSFKYVHAANSAAAFDHKETHFNMVRVGIALYGLNPFEGKPLPAMLKPVMTWKTVVAQVKTLPDNHPVGYGNTYHTRGEERIAILPVGYADGFRRAPNHWGKVLIHGEEAPLVGRVSMEKSAVNVTHIPNVSIGDEVVLIGRQQDKVITVEEVAAQLGTSNYEVVCSVLARVPRR